jgi:hypothetical protein
VFGRFAVGVNRNTSTWFAGSVDDVRIYDRALSPAEIQALAPFGEATLLSPAGGAMVYIPLPGPFAPSVEKLVVDKVHEQVRKVRALKSN